ncbi:hypothetical protein GWI33_010520 [Rhynchophorus ferrugineus]|uniref:Uncharacterized protein n=1 Tax=Rhynchophorus ferrugineus TaxID=354439 RepID=A0A834MJM5_RHYFE|nr:hypothetical protein GWI33_010520 [Rhynchophorus ferrugineus]
MSFGTINSEKVNETDFGDSGFDYVVEIKHSEKVCFGSTITRSTAPIGKHLSPFQKRISPEIFKPGPGSYHNEVYSSALYPLMNKVQSKRGVGPLASRDERFKEKIIRTPSPGRYNVIPKEEFRESKAPFGVAAAITRQRHNNIPGPATYNTRKIKKCRRTKLSDNFGKPNMIYAIETTCVSVPIDTCQKCNKLCTGDYWHLDYSEFLCQLCWMEERSVPELYTKEVLKTMKKIRNCFFMHNHQGTDAAIITMPLNTVKKKVRIENYLDLYLEC